MIHTTLFTNNKPTDCPQHGGKGDNMKTLLLNQKMSNVGSIHDIESDMFEREIQFPSGCKYAVILAAYYGGKGYTTHRTKETTIKKSIADRKYSHQILDYDGNHYDNVYGELKQI